MGNSNNQESCCKKTDLKMDKKGFISGILYGLAPHTFCIAFIIFTVLGVTTATALLKPLLLNPYFFYILIGLSIVFATISALIYLKKNAILSFLGIKRKWKYLSILYGTTIFINLLLFMVIFPIVANLNSGVGLRASLIDTFRSESGFESSESGSLITLRVAIPCPGHAPLIIGELKKISGVENVKFRFPNLFDVDYNSQKTSQGEILSLEVFNTYKATVVNGQKGSVIEVVGNNAGGSQSSVGSCAVGCAGNSGGCSCGCRR